jgi:CheY-like chemotaxis protein
MPRIQEEIRILIIEDEKVWAEILATYLRDLGYAVAGVANTFEEAITLLNKAEYDLALVDINLNVTASGIELGRMLHNLYRKPYIFLTANTEHTTLADAVAAKPSAYLPKPVNLTSLTVAIQSALNSFSSTAVEPAAGPIQEDSTFFFVKHGNKYKKTDWKDVVYLRSDKNYTLFFSAADKNEYSIRCTLQKALNNIIPEQLQSRFAQVNRSEAVQITFIQEITSEELRTPYGKFAITEGYQKELKIKLHVIS